MEVDFASRYIWRGIDLIPDNQPAIQPWFNASYALTDKLTLNYLFWADYRLVSGGDPPDRNNKFDEFDHIPYLTYALNDTYSFELGYILYYLPSLTNAQEFYGGVNIALPYNLATSLYLYYNFDDGHPDDNGHVDKIGDGLDGVYVKWKVDGSLPLSDHANLNGSVGLGYMSYDQYGADFKDGFSDLPISIGVSTELGHGPLGLHIGQLQRDPGRPAGQRMEQQERRMGHGRHRLFPVNLREGEGRRGGLCAFRPSATLGQTHRKG